MNKNSLKQVLISRAKRCIELSNGILEKGTYYIAGSAIASSKIRDIDVFPVKFQPFDIPVEGRIVTTKNAVTIKNKPPIQFCSYKKNTLRELIKSFDFSHIQAGAHIQGGEVMGVDYTEEFLYSKASGNSSFVGSEYPLSSLVRLPKYYKRGELSRSALIGSTLTILHHIVERGFKDYEDFKDQLDAVDLGMIPEELDELSEKMNLLNELFRLLSKV